MSVDDRRRSSDPVPSAGPGGTSDLAVPAEVYHFDERSALRRFVPAKPPSIPSDPPVVVAVDDAHSPLHWFPRSVPRISVWAEDSDQRAVLTRLFGTEAARVVAVEHRSLDAVRTAVVHRYVFDGSPFRPWYDPGHYVSTTAVEPVRVDVIDDLLAAHAAAGVELRLTPRLGALVDSIVVSGLPYGFVRIRDASH